MLLICLIQAGVYPWVHIQAYFQRFVLWDNNEKFEEVTGMHLQNHVEDPDMNNRNSHLRFKSAADAISEQVSHLHGISMNTIEEYSTRGNYIP